MELRERRQLSLSLVTLFLLVTALPFVNADGSGSEISIQVDWTDGDGDEIPEHRYIISFETAPDPTEWSVIVSHSDSNGNSIGSWNFTWGDENYSLEPVNSTRYSVTVPSNLSFGDSIDISAFQLNQPASASRTIDVTLWNQPLADHEITVTTDWTLRHTLENQTTDEYVLDFSGQGWQKRTGTLMEHDELGDGQLLVNETAEDGTNVMLVIDLDLIWLNETMNGSQLQTQIFEMAGTGDLTIASQDAEADTLITGNIVDAYILRSMDNGVVEEKMRLEANGNLNVSSITNDSEMWLDGDLSLLYVEVHDLGGVRLLDHTQFEATGNMEIQEGGSYFQFDLDELLNLERWENGTRVDQHSKMRGDGSFYFSDTNDDNGSIVINGDIITFLQESEDGNKTGDTIHIDGDISGATTGSFGIWRRIDGQRDTANSTGVLWPVNKIHQEEWFNLTGGGILDGMGPSQSYNETWDHEVVYENYTNRTIYYTWYEQSDEPSQGEEYPENSPIPIPEDNTTDEESALGDVNISRETGFAPSELLVGDSLGLYDSVLMHLELTADSYDTYTRDGHTMQVTRWTGDYANEGTASGAVVNEGILAGLLAEVSRGVNIEIDGNQTIGFWENQSLERVIAPSIISASENTAPSVLQVRLHEGEVINEGGNLVHLEVEVDDPDWNIREVSVDLSDLMLPTLTLNDLGLDGDIMVHDDNWTASFTYYGTLAGNISVDVTVTDAWTQTVETNTIPVSHRGPRMTDFTLSQNTVQRGDNLTVGVRAYDALGVAKVTVDLLGEGGEAFDLVDDGGGLWSGEVTIPSTTSPGTLLLPIRLEDSAGAWVTTTRLLVAPGTQGAGLGGDAWDAPTTSAEAVNVVNEGPTISEFTILKDGGEISEIIVPEIGEGSEIYVLTVRADDPDIITVVQGRLGMLAPVGQDTTWQTLTDDGQGADMVAGDGIYSVQIEVRPGLAAESVDLRFRGIDVFLGTTNPSYTVTVNLTEEEVDPLTNPGDALFDLASTTAIVLITLGLLLLGGGIAIIVVIRRSGGLDEQMGIITQLPDDQQ